MDEEELKDRTKKLGLRVINLVNALPKSPSSDVIGRQLLRSGTSVGANYRAACRGKSKKDFVYKLEIAIEEADESLYWLELIVEAGILPEERLTALMQECDEIISILTASAKTTRKSVSK